MNKVSTGKKIPEFNLLATGDKKIKLSDLKGNNVVLYFYPKDSTPGCTQEGLDFQELMRKFKTLNTVIIGVSRDNLNSHEKFKNKQGFGFDLIADEEETLCGLFDVIKMKNMYGRKVRGIERSTFLIDSKGILRREWRKVKVKGHAEEVLKAVKEI